MYQQLPKLSSNASSTSSQGSTSSFELSNFPMPPKAKKSQPQSKLPQPPSFVTSNTGSQGVDIPGVDPRSHNGLKNCYNELYQSQTFRKQVHDIITSGQKIVLTLTQGIGGAVYNTDAHEIIIYSQNQDRCNELAGLTNIRPSQIQSAIVAFELSREKLPPSLSAMEN